MIHIADTKVARRYGDFFIRNIHKFDEVCICHLVRFIMLQSVSDLHIVIYTVFQKKRDHIFDDKLK